MRQLAWWLAGATALAALGCSGGGNSPLAPAHHGADPNFNATLPQSAPAITTSASGALGTVYQSGDLLESALAIYTLDIDPGSLSATARLKAVREGQANDDLYLLPIDSFLRADSLRVLSLSRNGSDLELTYALAHPFPAPKDPAGTPNGFDNRADLGITGMVLFLADVADATGNTYFTDKVANTALVTNADAYYKPAGMLDLTSTANLFPYKLLVDEAADSRRGFSNGGDVTGNFGTDGWTRSELAGGWTGYGVLHQGQSSINTVAFDVTELGGGLSIDVAVIAKYNDPRGGATPGEKKANRLPPATADASLFAYRMPHGALDVQRIAYLGESGGFIANQLSGSTLRFHVEDWDARANDSAETDLAQDPSFTNVAQGESGFPALSLCIPGVLGDATAVANMAPVPVNDDSAYGGDVDPDSGQPGDALFYQEAITKLSVGGQTGGTYTGMVQATDPEDPSLTFPLDGSLGLVTSNPPQNRTYQVFTVDLMADNNPPTATVVLTSANPMDSGTMPSLSIVGISDAENDTLNIFVDWDNGGGFVPVAAGLNSPYPPQNPVGPQRNNTTLTPAAVNMTVRLDDGANITDYPVSYTLGPNRPPQLTGTPALQQPAMTSPASFVMLQGTAAWSDPEGDTVTFEIRNTANGNAPTFAAFPNAANTTAIITMGPVDFTVYAKDPLHGNITPAQPNSAAAWPVINGTVISNPGWLYRGTAQSSGNEQGLAIAQDSAGALYYAGYFSGTTTNFGSGIVSATANTGYGVGIAPNIFLVKLTSNGTHVWDRTIRTASLAAAPPDTGQTGISELGGIAIDNAGNVLVYGSWRGILHFLPDTGDSYNSFAQTDSVLNASNDLFIVRYSTAGAITGFWSSTGPGQADVSQCFGHNAIDIDAANNVYITGRYNRNEDLGATTLNSAHGALSANFDPFLARINTGSWTVNWATNYAPSVSATAPATQVESGQSVRVTSTGHVLNGGYYTSLTTGVAPNLMDFGGGVRTVRITSTGAMDAYITMRSQATGAWVWDRVYGGTTAGVEHVNGLTSSSTRVFAAGQYFNGTNFNGSTNITATGGSDPYVLALDISDGGYIWVRPFGGSSASESAYTPALAGTNLYVCGDYNNGTIFDPPFGETSQGIAGFVVKMTAATGAMVYHRIFDGTTSGTDRVRDIITDSFGDLFIAGEYGTANFDADPGPGVVTPPSQGALEHFAARFLGATGSF